MKSSRKWTVAAAALLFAGTLGAQLARRLQHMDAASPLRAVFYRANTLPGGVTEIRRPPRETRPELDKRIAGAANDPELLALRAREAELALDFTAAEADWKRYVTTARDQTAAQLELAAFYHRRLQPREEFAALLEAGRTAPNSQPFGQALTLAVEQGLGGEAIEQTQRALAARFPNDRELQRNAVSTLAFHKRYAAAETLLAGYTRTFADDPAYPVQARAEIARARGNPQEARAIYERGFDPLWPHYVIAGYFNLLKETRSTRKWLEDAQRAINARPLEFAPAALLHHYYSVEQNRAAAQRVLAGYRARKEAKAVAFTAGELGALGTLFEHISAYEDAARAWYALYSLAGATPAQQETALASLTNLLLNVPETPVRFGTGDLTMYRDIATMDRYPGALNGILSLLLNTSGPEDNYRAERTASLSYFHRAKAAELVALFERRFPSSPRRAELQAGLIAAYSALAEWEGVLRAGRKFLADFPQAAQRTQVALTVASAHAARNELTGELALYDATLKELAARAKGTPLSDAAVRRDYELVLDRYIARLVSLKRVNDALTLYRNEIARSPNEPALYERLAAFLDQNRLAAQTEQVYQQAIAQFKEASWSQKLARWYLRQKRTADFDRITSQVARTFSGTELETYFQDLVQPGLDAVLYRQVNLYAHQRFPDNLVFINNLLAAYQRKETYDAAAYEALLRRYWTFDPALRNRFFQHLSANGRLQSELSALASRPADNANLAATTMLAEGQSWQCRYESAAPLLRTLHEAYPGNEALATRAASAHRSLAAFDPAMAETAVAILNDSARANPRSTAALTTIGEIYADMERFDKAREWWLKIPSVEPAQSKGYLEAATVFWDYFRYDDALGQIEAARKKHNDPALFAFETGAIYEGKRDYARAVAEYVRGALAENRNAEAWNRLLLLARRPQTRDLVETQTAQQSGTIAAWELRAAVLDAQDRRADIERLAAATLQRATAPELIDSIEKIAADKGFDAVARQVAARRLALATDPVDKLRLRLALARFDEGRGDTRSAAQQMDALYRENPLISGIVRETVDHHWRNQNRDRAISVLLEAAQKAHPELARQFTVEAASKALEARQFARVRQIVGPRLKSEPFAPDLLQLTAASYAGEGNDTALRQFYLATLDQARAAGGAQADIAALRRGLIPALTRLQDYAGAVDQYIELINRSAEDTGTIAEAALYARTHNLAARLTGYYARTAAASPKDYRWPYIQARIFTTLENYDAAIEAYQRAAAVRPDRTDLLAAQAGFEERLLRFEDAAKTYSRLYDLSYRNAFFLAKTAEMRARLNQPEAAVAALRRGFLDGRPENASDYLEVARKLDAWNLSAQARPFAEKAAALDPSAAALGVWAGITTRMRQADAAFARLMKEPNGGDALVRIGDAVAAYFTPEEKQAFAAVVDKARASLPPEDATARLLPLVHAAGLADLEGRLLIAGGPAYQFRAIEFEVDRMRAVDIGRVLEARVKSAAPEQRIELLLRAAENYRLAGYSADELRVLTAVRELNSSAEGARFYELLMRRDPKRLIALAAGDISAVNAALEGDNADTAISAVRSFGATRKPLWSNAYTALTGYYYGRTSPPVRDAFVAALGPDTVGRQLAAAKSRDEALVGDNWFYYAARYGDWMLLASEKAEAENYLPASVENTPARASAYFDLAQAYERSAQPERALDEYRHTVDLAPNRAGAIDHIAAIEWERGNRDAALAAWKQALGAYMRILNGRAQERLWEDLPATLGNLGRRNLVAQFQPEVDRILRTYISRNGFYRADEVIQPLVPAVAGQQAEFLATVAQWANDPLQFLINEIDISRRSPEVVARLYPKVFALAAAKAERSFGRARASALEEARQQRMRHVMWLVEQKQGKAALDAVAQIDPASRRALPSLPLFELRAAGLAGNVESLLARYRRDPGAEPSHETLLQAAQEMRKQGAVAPAQAVLEYAYTRQLDGGNLTASNFLGLAEIRLLQNQPAAAVALLRRMVLVGTDPYEGYLPAASLLARNGRAGEAAEFYASALKATPWSAPASLGVGTVELLQKIAGSRDAAYPDRVAAAQRLGQNNARGDYGSGELNLLAAGDPIPAASADKPYFVEARLAAAQQSAAPNEKVALLRAALAVRPGDTAVRATLIQAAAEAKLYDTLLMAAQRMLRERGMPFVMPPPEQGSPGEEWRMDAAESFLDTLPLDSAARSRIASALAEGFRSQQRFAPALFYYRLAETLVPAEATKRLMEVCRAEQQRRFTNSIRKPNISENFEQASLVLPKVLTGGAR